MAVYGHGTSIEPLPDNIRAVIFDFDNTIHEGSIAEDLGKKLLTSQLTQFPPRMVRFAKGYIGAREVRKIVKKNGVEGYALGMKKFLEVVGETLRVERRTLRGLTREAINEIPGFSFFNNELQRRGIGTYVSTASYDEIGRVCFDIYGIKAYAANQSLWQNHGGVILRGDEIVYKRSNGYGSQIFNGDDVLMGATISIKTPEDKRRANEEMMKLDGIRNEDVAIVGNDILEHPSMERFGMSMTSPNADKETVEHVRKLGGRVIGDYNVAAKMLLRNSQPRTR